MKLQLPTLIVVCLAILLIAGIYFFGGDKTELGNAVNLESEEFKQLRTNATNAFNAGQYEQAIELYSSALRIRPQNAEIHNDLGAVYYEQGLKVAGPSWPAWKKEVTDDSVERALKELRVAIDETGSGAIRFSIQDAAVADAIEAEAKHLGGEVYRRSGNETTTLNILIGATKDYLLRARDRYIRALDLKPTHSLAHRNLGSFYMKVGKTDKALGHFEEAYRLDPRDAELEEYLHQFRK